MNESDFPERIRQAREQWFYRGQKRPDFADEPNANQQSVWDFPRPPALVQCEYRCEVRLKNVETSDAPLVIASSDRCLMVCETAHTPTYYFPKDDVSQEFVRRVRGSSFCEWKGSASYFSVVSGTFRAERSAWSYESPFEEFDGLQGAVAFMPAPFDCRVDGEQVRPQPGGFYGGWITSHFSGPFKGEPGISG